MKFQDMMGAVQHTKIVHITTVAQTLQFFPGHFEHLRTRGFDVSAVCAPDDLLQQMRDAMPRVVISTIPMARPISLLSDLTSLARLVSHIRRVRPIILHAHTPKAGLLGPIAARIAGVPIVMVSVFGLPQMTGTKSLKRILDATTRVSCRLADRVWCDSASMYTHMAREGLCAESKLVVLGHGSVMGVDARGAYDPSGISPQDGAALRREYGIPADALVLGYAGRVVGDKGIHELAEAWRALKVVSPRLHLLLVGQVEERDPVPPEDIAMLSADPNVHLVGHQPNMPHQYRIMDIFVMPSYREGFGMTNIEAAAMGLPVVATNIPGCVDAVQDGVTGTLVPPRDVGALVDALRMYIKDPELRTRHGQAGRERVLRDFQQEAIWEALYQEYCRLLRENGLPVPEPLPEEAVGASRSG